MICNFQLSHIYFHSALSSQKTQVKIYGPSQITNIFQECLPPLLLLITLNSLIRSHLLLPLPPPPPLVVAPGLLHTRLHSLLILPPILLRTGLVEQIFNGLKTLKSCAAMELAGELGFGSLSRDWMLVRMADTS